MKMYTTNDGYRAPDLLQAGFDHLDAAYELFELNPRFLDSAGYLAHLGLELVLKAYLLHLKGAFKDTHSLQSLVKDIRELNPKFILQSPTEPFLRELDTFYGLRYPQPEVAKRAEVGSDMVPDIKALEHAVWADLPEELRAVYGAVDHTRKSGRILMRKRKE